MLTFKDCSVTKHVANYMNYVIVIETDWTHRGRLQVNIYKDTVASLGGEYITGVGDIHGFFEAKKRAEMLIANILRKENLWAK